MPADASNLATRCSSLKKVAGPSVEDRGLYFYHFGSSRSGHRRPRSPRPRLPEPRTSSPTRESDTVAPTLARPRCHLQDRLRRGKSQPLSRTTPYNTMCLRACRGGRAADVDTGSKRSAPEVAAVTGVLCTGRDATCSVRATTRRDKSYVLVVILLQHRCARDRPLTRRSGHSCDHKSSYGVGR